MLGFFMNTYNVRMPVHCNYRGLWAIQAFQRKNNILFKRTNNFILAPIKTYGI